MRLHRLTLENVRWFKRDGVIDFDDFGDGVVAVAGPNGSGKTTLLECMAPVPLFRQTPTRSSNDLSNLFPRGAGSIRLEFGLNGERYLSDIRASRSGDMTYRLESEREGPLANGKAKDYDRVMQTLVGPAKAFYASAYACQDGGGRMAGLTSGDRKAVFRHFLGLARLELLLKETKRRLDEASDVQSRVQMWRQDLPSLEQRKESLRSQIATSRRRLDESRRAVEDSRKLLETSREDHEAYEAGQRHDRALTRLLERRAAIVKRGQAAKSEMATMPEEREALAFDALALSKAREALSKLTLEGSRLENEKRTIESSCQRAGRDLAAATRQASLIERVPCGAGGKFAACEFLRDAVKAQQSLQELKQHLDQMEQSLVDVAAPPDTRAAVASVKRLEQEASQANEIVAANTRLAARRAQAQRDLTASKADYLATKAEEEQLGPRPVSPDGYHPEQRQQAEQTLEQEQRNLLGLEREVARLEGEVTAISANIKKIQESLRSAEADVQIGDQLRFLVEALGPRGVQALEIAAAGPTISDVANQILLGAYGPRFSVVISTERELQSGDGTTEELAIRVMDHEFRRQAEAVDLRDISGGEQVVVDEAIRTSLAIFANQRLKTPFRTLWRDEASGALDEANSIRYVDMLRHARTVGGCGHVIFVSHNPQVQEAADVVVEIQDGEIVTRKPR